MNNLKINSNEQSELELMRAINSMSINEFVLVPYSDLEQQNLKENDLIKVKSYTSNYLLNQLKNTFSIKFEQSIMEIVKKEITPTELKKINEILSFVSSSNFNIFDLNDYAERNSMLFLVDECFNKMNLYNKNSLISSEMINTFVKEITNGYDRSVLYHNDLHACDVFQTVYCIFNQGNLKEKLKLDYLDVISLFIASISHDYKHMGLNNAYHVKTQSDIAITYNDKSVLENYHISETYKLIGKINIFENFKAEEKRLIRRRMIDCVLATDISYHPSVLASLVKNVELFDIKKGKNVEKMIYCDNIAKTFENQQIVLNLLIHSADISNPCKSASITRIWVDLLFMEYFEQGDLERKNNIPFTMFCDRKTTNINKCQYGFVRYIVKPTFECLLCISPEVESYFKNILENEKRYEKLVNDD